MDPAGAPRAFPRSHGPPKRVGLGLAANLASQDSREETTRKLFSCQMEVQHQINITTFPLIITPLLSSHG